MWNEVWILRPDYPDVDNSGWHVIDATPQEKSLGEHIHTSTEYIRIKVVFTGIVMTAIMMIMMVMTAVMMMTMMMMLEI